MQAPAVHAVGSPAPEQFQSSCCYLTCNVVYRREEAVLPQSSKELQQPQHRPPLPGELLSILRELDLLNCADILSGGGFRNAGDIVVAGANVGDWLTRNRFLFFCMVLNC